MNKRTHSSTNTL